MVGVPTAAAARAASMEAAAISARITMPAPPPAGVSSTLRCLPVAKSRMSMAASAHLPSPRALPARLEPSGPGNISGKIVSTLACQVMGSLDHLRRHDLEPAALDVDLGHGGVGEG